MTVNGKPGLHGQAVLIPVVLLMELGIKPDQGQKLQIHHYMAEMLALELMEVTLNLAVLSVLVSKTEVVIELFELLGDVIPFYI